MTIYLASVPEKDFIWIIIEIDDSNLRIFK